jgi:hypothetical protein
VVCAWGSHLGDGSEPWEIEHRERWWRWLQPTVGPPRVLLRWVIATMDPRCSNLWILALDGGNRGSGEAGSSLKLCLFCDTLQRMVVGSEGTGITGAHLYMTVLTHVCVLHSSAPPKHRPCSVHRGW